MHQWTNAKEKLYKNSDTDSQSKHLQPKNKISLTAKSNGICILRKESKWTTLTQQQQKNLLELQNCMKARMFVLKHFFFLSPPQIWLMDSLSILHHHHQQCILKATINMKPCHPLCIFSEGSEKKVNAIFFCWEGWYLVEVKFNENMPMLKIFSEDNVAISNFPSFSIEAFCFRRIIHLSSNKSVPKIQ